MTHFEVPHIHFFLYIFNIQREDNLPIKDKLPATNVSIIIRFHYITEVLCLRAISKSLSPQIFVSVGLSVCNKLSKEGCYTEQCFSVEGSQRYTCTRTVYIDKQRQKFLVRITGRHQA